MASERPAPELRSVEVRRLVGRTELGLELVLVAGETGLARRVAGNRIQKSGLALAGHFRGIDAARIQVFGVTEVSYLESLEPVVRRERLGAFFALEPCAVLVSESARTLAPGGCVADDLLDAARASDTPLLACSVRSSAAITVLHGALDRMLAPRQRVHGVLVDVHDVGLLLLGPSGVGKSEVALELIMRGHRLVADDVVDCTAGPSGTVYGEPPEALRHHLEVRGLGILQVKDLFGVTAVRDRKRVDVLVRLVEGEGEHDRLGLERREHALVGVALPELSVPVRPGRDMASIMEVAARRHLLAQGGDGAAGDLVRRIDAAVRDGARGSRREAP